jgi:hypothetical protein
MQNWNLLLVAVAFDKAELLKHLIGSGMYVNLYGIDPNWDNKQETKFMAECFCLMICIQTKSVDCFKELWNQHVAWDFEQLDFMLDQLVKA